MIDFRFTGHMPNQGAVVDITLRTDAISKTDTNFNILQIQSGTTFETADSQNNPFRSYFSSTFGLKNTAYTDIYNFSVTNGLNLRAIDMNGVVTKVVMDDSVSTSV